MEFNKPSIFSASPLWDLQRAYFEESQIQAWSTGQVPHYVTSNPYMAGTYANFILAFMEDLEKKGKSNEPIYIVELGAGSGRFSYHLLKALEKLGPLPFSFTYVITDFVEEQIEYWNSHPRLQSYIASGVLDFALFDAEKDDKLKLRKSGKTISKNSLKNPLILVANYFFDSIKQELFYFENGKAKDVTVTLNKEETDDDSENPNSLKNLDVNYDTIDCREGLFTSPNQEKVFDQYRKEIKSKYVLFPTTGLQCIDRLQQLSQEGLMLLTADKGSHRLKDIQQNNPPEIVEHGSFSLNTNYHALSKHCALQNGKPLFPTSVQFHITVGCLLYVKGAESFTKTIRNYKHTLDKFGPDEYFSIKKHVEQNILDLSPSHLFSYLKLSGNDARLFHQFLPQFHLLVHDFNEDQRLSLLKLVAEVWDGYYPIGETNNLAFDIALLLSDFRFFDESLAFLDLSQKLYNEHWDTLYLRAICQVGQNKIKAAQTTLDHLLTHEPNHNGGRILLESLEKA